MTVCDRRIMKEILFIEIMVIERCVYYYFFVSTFTVYWVAQKLCMDFPT